MYISKVSDAYNNVEYNVNTSTWVTGCALYSISAVGSYNNAIEAMTAFCKANQRGNGKLSQLAAHYVWTAGPEVRPGGKDSSHHCKPWTRYGTEFAKYITDNNLGLVSTLPAILNIKHHPNTTCQVWVWQPNMLTMQAWWDLAEKPAPIPIGENPVLLPVIKPKRKYVRKAKVEVKINE